MFLFYVVYLVSTLIHVYDYMFINISWLEITMYEIQNENLFIFFVVTLFSLSDGWMVNALACQHGDKLHALLN
jgi:hypothetical protein